MTDHLPTGSTETSPEAAPAAAPDAAGKAALQGVETAQGQHVKLAEDVEAGQKPDDTVPPTGGEGVDADEDFEEDTDSDSPSNTDTTPPKTETQSEEQGWLPKEWSFTAIGSWLSGGWDKLSKAFDDLFAGFKKMLPDWEIFKDDEEKKPGQTAKDKPTDSTADNKPGQTAKNTPTDTTADTKPAKPVYGPSEFASELVPECTVNSWEEVKAIQDLPKRAVQAALYGFKSDLDCFLKDRDGSVANHCSGWCDSVMNKAGLGSVYDDQNRLYCNYKSWKKKGTMQGLELQPGDCIIRYNGNGSSGFHHEFILSSTGPDENGNYSVTNLGQTSADGTSGVRKIRTITIRAEDIKLVQRPGATEPWNGDGSNLVS